MEQQIEYSGRASLVAVGQRFQALGLWEIVKAHVHIKQKTRQYAPLDKLLDCFINILAGGAGVVEVNTRVRPDRALQIAFGRSGCAEQSTISETLNACSSDNVTQLRAALNEILQRCGQAPQHAYEQRCQILDVDVTGLPAGRQGEGVEKGYFAQQKNCRGRQLGRVLATLYGELVVDRLYSGKRQLDASLQALVELAEAALPLSETQRARTILRVDSGAGDDKNLNWLLARDYQVLGKIKHWRRAEKLTRSVSTWYPDAKVPERMSGWVEVPHGYDQPTQQLAVRHRKRNGTNSDHVMVSTLSDALLLEVLGRAATESLSEETRARLTLYAYDLRGGGVETQNRGDKQGLHLGHRNKHRFAAQEMLVLLAQLAHNLTIWARNDLARCEPRLNKFGIQRTVRDAFNIDGHVTLTSTGAIEQIALNPHHPLTKAVNRAFVDEMSPYLGKN
jgi:Transposase DDE domain group 1